MCQFLCVTLSYAEILNWLLRVRRLTGKQWGLGFPPSFPLVCSSCLTVSKGASSVDDALPRCTNAKDSQCQLFSSSEPGYANSDSEANPLINAFGPLEPKDGAFFNSEYLNATWQNMQTVCPPGRGRWLRQMVGWRHRHREVKGLTEFLRPGPFCHEQDLTLLGGDRDDVTCPILEESNA